DGAALIASKGHLTDPLLKGAVFAHCREVIICPARGCDRESDVFTFTASPGQVPVPKGVKDIPSPDAPRRSDYRTPEPEGDLQGSSQECNSPSWQSPTFHLDRNLPPLFVRPTKRKFAFSSINPHPDLWLYNRTLPARALDRVVQQEIRRHHRRQSQPQLRDGQPLLHAHLDHQRRLRFDVSIGSLANHSFPWYR